MSNQLFQQNLDDKKGPQPGGPYLIQMLFKEPVDMPDKETMTAVIWGSLLSKTRLLTGTCRMSSHSNQMREMRRRSLFL